MPVKYRVISDDAPAESVVPTQESQLPSGEYRIKADRAYPSNIPSQTTPPPVDYYSDVPQSQEDPSLARRLSTSLAQGTELPGNIVNALNMALGEPSLKQGPSISESLSAGFSPQQMEPQGVVERYAQKGLKQLPTAAIFGPAAMARTAVSGIPATAVGELGGPEWLQDLTQLGADLGIGYGLGKLAQRSAKAAEKAGTFAEKGFPSAPLGLEKLEGMAQQQFRAYKAAEELVPNAEKFGAGAVVKGIVESTKRIGTEVNKKLRNEVVDVIQQVKKNFSRVFDAVTGEVGEELLNPRTGMALRRSINDLIRKNDDLFPHLEPIQNGIRDFFTQYSFSNPRFYDQLTKADKLTMAKNMPSLISEFIGKIPMPSGILGSLGGGIRDVVKGAFGATVGSVEKFARNVITNDVAREFYFNMANGIAEGNPAVVLKGISDLTEWKTREKSPAQKYVKTETPTKKPSVRYKVIS